MVVIRYLATDGAAGVAAGVAGIATGAVRGEITTGGVKAVADGLARAGQDDSVGPAVGQVAVVLAVEAILGGGGVIGVVTGAALVTDVRAPLLGEAVANTIGEGQQGGHSAVQAVLAGDAGLHGTLAVGAGVGHGAKITSLLFGKGG